MRIKNILTINPDSINLIKYFVKLYKIITIKGKFELRKNVKDFSIIIELKKNNSKVLKTIKIRVINSISNNYFYE